MEPQIEQNFKTTSIEKRLLAFILDTLISWVLTVVIYGIVIAVKGYSEQLIVKYIFDMSLMNAFFIVMKDAFGGASIGKRIVKIRVAKVSSVDEKPSILALILRNALLMVWPIELISLLLSKDKRRLGETLTGTQVVDLKSVSSKWLIPTFIAVGALAMTIFVAALFIGITAQFKNEASYLTATNYIEHDAKIVELTGGVVGFGQIPTGSISVSNGRGSANLNIKVIGKLKNINVYIELAKSPNETWRVVRVAY